MSHSSKIDHLLKQKMLDLVLKLDTFRISMYGHGHTIKNSLEKDKKKT